MDPRLDADQRFFQSTTRRYLESRMPTAEVRRLAATPDGFERPWWAGGAELGWTSFLAGDEAGGGSLSGNGTADLAIVAEEFGRSVAPGPLIGTNVVLAAICSPGAGDAHADAARQLLSGEATGAWAVDDEGHAWAPEDPQLAARPGGDGFVLAGRKVRVEYGAQAGWFLVSAQADGRPTQFLVPASAPGVEVEPLETLDLVRRYADVAFHDVRVPATAAIGDVGGAADALARQVQIVAVLQCAEMAGAADRTLAMAVAWAEDRYTFGRPLNSYQALKHRFADMKVAVEASHATTTAAAHAVGQGSGDAARLASVAKAYVGRAAVEVGQECVQMHGGIGLTWDHDLHLYLRGLTTDRVVGGAPRDHVRRLGCWAIEREKHD